MKRVTAVEEVLQHITDEVIIHANGMIGRESFTCKNRKENFYMIGSMGLATSIGMGVAMSQPDKKVVVFDGDGNLLMNLGALCQATFHDLKNYYHIVFDNEAYGSTGDQPAISSHVELELMAEAAGYKSVYKLVDIDEIREVVPQFLNEEGPTFLLIKVEKGNVKGIGRVTLTPEEITDQIRSLF